MGFKVKNYNSFFLVAGVLCIIIGLVALTFIHSKEVNHVKITYNEWKKNLIDHGLKIEVDFQQIQIKSADYLQEVNKNNISNQYMVLDALAGNDSSTFNHVKECVLVYEKEVSGEKIVFYSTVISKDEITVRFLLENQKKTFIYMDRKNEEDYFFDLDFLFNS